MSHFSKRILTILVFLAIATGGLLLHPYAVWAANDQSAFSMSVPSVSSITAGSGTMFFTPVLSELLAGETTPQDLGLTVSTNVDWVLTITGSQATWTGPWSKPVGDIYWKYGAGDYAALTTSPAEVTTGGPVEEGDYPVSIKIALDLVTDEPGEYSYTYIVIELTAP
ncbi:MAG: hypothetical protein NTY09_11110 [bacterium]|nr:hypothetical protein [bacterium]